MNVITWLFGISTLIGVTYGAKILAVVPTPTKSHHFVVEKLALDLANRGHQVTLITPFRQEKPVKNLEEVIFPNYYDKLMEAFTGQNDTKNLGLSSLKPNLFASTFVLPTMGLAMTEMFLSTPVIQKFIQSDRKYDLVIGEVFVVEAALAGFVKKYNAPFIGVAPGPTNLFSNYMTGNPSPTSYVPSILLDCTDRMSFKERMINFVIETISSIFFHTIYLNQQDALMRKHFGDNLPHVKSIMTNTSLIFVNHHFSLAFPRPYLPNMIEIGGYHVKPLRPLPKDIQQYLDDAKHGVIMMSMGSHLKSSLIPKETVQAIVKAFSRLKENVIWKFDDPNIPNLPKNVKIMKWLPQSDILGHPNLKLVIIHGGMLSTTEAILRGVPLIGLPVFGDQPSNMRFIERAGYGKSISIMELTADSLYNAIQEILQNPKYRENVKKGSSLLQDTPRPSSETTMFWVEYVIRHKGAPHLRSAALDLEWYQLYLFDVLAVILIAVALTSWIFYRITTCIWRKLCGREQKKTSQKKKTN